MFRSLVGSSARAAVFAAALGVVSFIAPTPASATLQGACCINGGCQFLTPGQCSSGKGSYQGDFVSCPANCAIATTTTTFETTTTTLPAVGACCSDGCFLTTEQSCGNAYQGDGTTCSPINPCSVCGNGIVSGFEECDDGDTSSGDGCSSSCQEEECYNCIEIGVNIPIGGVSVCTPLNGTPCDDGDVCTLGDICTTGSCGGEGVLIPAACEWVMVGGDPDRNVQARVRGNATVVGDICADTVRIGDSASITGDIVATETDGRGIFFAAAATVTGGDVITDGASVVGKPRDTLLPGLTTDEVPGGTTATGVPSPDYDTTGNSTRVEDCDDAQSDIDSGATAVDALPQTSDEGDVQVKGNQSRTFTATNVGGLNVLDFDRLRTGNNATITLDGGGNPNTVFVLRVAKKLDIRFQSDIVLTNGTSPGHVLIKGDSKCKFGEEVTGAGTVLCPDGKLSLEERVVWTGAILGGKKRVQLRDSGELTHAPLQIGS